jgi:hypothetical protein
MVHQDRVSHKYIDTCNNYLLDLCTTSQDWAGDVLDRYLWQDFIGYMQIVSIDRVIHKHQHNVIEGQENSNADEDV